MKKLIFLICFITGIFTISSVHAQEVFRTGDGILNASIGVGSPVYSRWGDFSPLLPPLAVSYELGIMDNLFDGNASIGVGGYFGISSSRYRYSGATYTSSSIVVGPRGSFHYYFVEDLDTYAGLLLGANFISNRSDYGPVGGFAVDAFVGARYYFQPNIAAMAEIGFGAIAFLNVGVALRLY